MILKPGMSWADAYARCLAAAPEAFDDDRVRNYWSGQWWRDGEPEPATSPVDGTPIAGPPLVPAEHAAQAVRAAADRHREWRSTPLAERKARIQAD